MNLNLRAEDEFLNLRAEDAFEYKQVKELDRELLAIFSAYIWEIWEYNTLKHIEM